MSKNLHQNFVKLIHEDDIEFEYQFAPELRAEVLRALAALPEDDDLVWTPTDITIPEDQIRPFGIDNTKAHVASVLQVIHGKIFLKDLSVLEIAGGYYVSEEALN